MNNNKTPNPKIKIRDFSSEREYWSKKYAGEVHKTSIRYDNVVNDADNGDFSKFRISLDYELTLKLIKVSKNSDVKLFVVLVSGLFQILKKYIDTEEFIILIPIATQKSLGNFINTVLPLKCQVEENNSFREILERANKEIVGSIEHQNYPIDFILNGLKLNDEENKGFALTDFAVLLDKIHSKDYLNSTKTNITLNFFRNLDNIECEVEFNTNLFKKKTLELFLGHFQILLNQSLSNPDKKNKEFSVLSEVEKQKYLYDFNKTETKLPEVNSIIEIITENCFKYAKETAIIDDDESISYREMQNIVNYLVYKFQQIGVQQNDVIAIMGHRSIEIIASILAILKIGATYLPVNAQDPDERIDFILSDSNASFIFLQEHVIKTKKCISSYSDKVVSIDSLYIEYKSELGNKEIEEVRNNFNAQSTAYIIYTSGSTGFPKGVLISNLGLLNYINWAKLTYLNGGFCHPNTLVIPFYSSFSFDMSITSLFLPLFSGNTIKVYRGESKEFLLDQIIEENKVDIVKVTPSHLKILKTNYSDQHNIIDSRIKKIIVGGEKFDFQLANDIFKIFNNDVEIYNEYGPTEATVGCMIHKFAPLENAISSVPVGKPIANTQIYLLDKNLNPVAEGLFGEIYVSGLGLAKGYLNKIDITLATFIQNPFNEAQLLYKTGDMARWLPNKIIEYVGRDDNQVKIRGFRIELSGIEIKIKEVSGIIDAIVISKNINGDNQLIAYYISSKDISINLIKEHLVTSLPDYMIPSYYIRIDSIPISKNGKLEINQLPEIVFNSNSNYLAPRNEIEKQIVFIWSELLGLGSDTISITSNYFELGGHSLNATILISKINKELNVNVPLSQIFKTPTIKSFSKWLDQSVINCVKPVLPVEKKNYYDISKVQEGIFYMQEFSPLNTSNNIPCLFKVKENININRLNKAFKELIKRHESLRTSFHVFDEKPVQIINVDNTTFSIEEIDFEKPEQNYKELVLPFDLKKAPLFRVQFIKDKDDERWLFFDIHHIICDAISMRIFIEELIDIYSGQKLESLTMQYKDFSYWQNAIHSNGRLKENEKYWLNKINQEFENINLPVDKSQEYPDNYIYDELGFEFGYDETNDLRTLAKETKTSLYCVLHTLFIVWLYKISGNKKFVIGVPMTGRHRDEFSLIIGTFINMLIYNANIDNDMKFNVLLKETYKEILNNIDHQNVHLNYLLKGKKSFNATNLFTFFDVIFDFHNQSISEKIFFKKIENAMHLEPIDTRNNVSKCKLLLIANEDEDSIHFNLQYASNLFDKNTIIQLVEYFKQITSSVLKNEGNVIRELVNTNKKSSNIEAQLMMNLED